MIVFTEEKKFSREDVKELFLSVGWISGQYQGRLFKALMNSSTVVTAWDGARLAGLVRVLDDSEMVAYMHYVLVHPCLLYTSGGDDAGHGFKRKGGCRVVMKQGGGKVAEAAGSIAAHFRLSACLLYTSRCV